MEGYLAWSGSLKVSSEHLRKSRRGQVVSLQGTRSGHDIVYRMGSRMSGQPICAIYGSHTLLEMVVICSHVHPLTGFAGAALYTYKTCSVHCGKCNVLSVPPFKPIRAAHGGRCGINA